METSTANSPPIWSIKQNKKLVNWKWQHKKTKELMQTIHIFVSNFGEIQTNQRLKSPTFALTELNHTKWFITINTEYNNGNDGSNDNVSIFLHLVNTAMTSGEIAKFQMALINANGVKVVSKMCDEMDFSGPIGWGWRRFVTRDQIANKCGAQSNHDLRLWLAVCVRNLSGQLDSDEAESDDSDDFQQNQSFHFNYDLMNDQEYCDIMFTLEGDSVRAHSRLLAAKSTVFRAMFSDHDSRNRVNSNEYFIDNVESEVFYELITFLYKGYALNVERLAKKLLIAANNFGVKALKLMCDYVSYRPLTPHNAVEAIVFAEQYDSPTIRVRAVCYIAKYLPLVMQSTPESKWKEFEQQNKHLLQRIVSIRDFMCDCCCGQT